MSGGVGEGESKEGMCPWLTEVTGHHGRHLTIYILRVCGVIFFRRRKNIFGPHANNYVNNYVPV